MWGEMEKDAETIEAVRQGDHDRFAELVDRHQRLAYAIAWSRLGDANLAEEAAQESFVRAFRYLGALRQPGKFASWLGRIVRNAANVISRRERRQSEAREGWAIELDAEDDNAAESNLPDSGEVQAAMADLPDDYREALVLFYFQGESTAASAEIVGISEGSFRTRLSRARGKLRSAIKRRTEKALEDLRPRRNLTPLVLAALPSAPLGAQAAAVAGAVGGVGGKVVGGLFQGMVWSFMLPVASLFLGLIANDEIRKSFRDQKDPRVQVLADVQRTGLYMSLLMTLVIAGNFWLWQEFELPIQYGLAVPLGILALYLLMGLIRNIRVNRSAGGVGVYMMFLLILGWQALPLDAGNWRWYLYPVLASVVLYVAWRSRLATAARIDHNLFLRAAMGELAPAGDGAIGKELSLSDADLKRFALWLGERKLVYDRKLDASGMVLHLPPVLTGMWQYAWHPQRFRSILTISRAGRCTGSVSERDYLNLSSYGVCPKWRKELEEQTSAAFRSAVVAYFSGEEENAEDVLTPLKDEAVFKRSPNFTWPHKVIFGIGATAMLCFSFFALRGDFDYRPMGAMGRVPDFTDASARVILSPILEGFSKRSHSRSSSRLWGEWRYGKIAFPASLLSDEDRESLRKVIARDFGRSWNTTNAVDQWVYRIECSYQATHGGLFTQDELGTRGFSRERVRRAFTKRKDIHKALLRGWETFRGQKLFVVNPESWQLLEILKHFDSLDLVHGDAIAAEIAALQVLDTGAQFPNLSYDIDVSDLHGLFLTETFGLAENWSCIRVLAALDRLDVIDREAFVNGLLQYRHGAGLFGAKRMWSSAGIHGYADDTFYALDCLLVLKASDRLTDLQQWQFRARQDPYNPRVTEIEDDDLIAWIYQRRLADLLELSEVPKRFF